MDAQKRLQLLIERALAIKTIDAGRNTIYSFDKYCLHCMCGLKRPRIFDRREVKKLFKHSFCSAECVSKGPREVSTFQHKAKERHEPNKMQAQVVEEMAFASIDATNESRSKYGILRMVEFSERSYLRLDEKLEYMSRMTGDKWYPSKYYYWAGRLK